MPDTKIWEQRVAAWRADGRGQGVRRGRQFTGTCSLLGAQVAARRRRRDRSTAMVVRRRADGRLLRTAADTRRWHGPSARRDRDRSRPGPVVAASMGDLWRVLDRSAPGRR